MGRHIVIRVEGKLYSEFDIYLCTPQWGEAWEGFSCETLEPERIIELIEIEELLKEQS